MGTVGEQWVRGNQNVQISQVTGSTINVRIDGSPPRRVPLEPAVVPPGRNVRSPARLLRARSGVLPFVDRAGLLSGLTKWMTDPAPFAGYLVGGRGGSGKTRLGVQLSVEAGQRDWLCGLLSRTADQEQLEVLAGTPTARLVVIDYAESRGEQLGVVLPLLAEQATAELPVRVLLLVRAAPRRSDDWTEPLRGRGDWLDAVLDDVQVRVLDDSPPTSNERAALFVSAAAAFAARAQADPGTMHVPTAPAVLAGPAFSSPLLVSVAAYLAVHDPDGRTPTSRTDLLSELVAHEDRHWKATARALQVDVGDEELRRRVVAVITLAGADSEDEAADLLGLLPDLSDSSETSRRHAVARWGRDLYPGPRWWNPLEPDLLGEHLVATELAGFGAVLGGVLQRTDPAALVQPLDVYARAAAASPPLRDAVGTVISTNLEALCRVAIWQAANFTNLDLLLGTPTAAAALDRVLTVVDVDPATLPAAVDLFSNRADQILGPLMLTLTEKLTEHVRGPAASAPAVLEPALAASLTNLSVRLAEVGRRDEGLTAIQDAVKAYRRLAAANPAAYQPDLAMALNNLSVDLAAAGRREQALTASQDAVKAYRRLAAANPAAYQPDLAMALNNLSVRLAEAGRRDEGLTAIQNAVEVHRRLAAANPAAYQLGLAMALNNLSVDLADAGRRDEALAASQDAVHMYRQLAAANPAAYRPELAMSLSNLSLRLAAAGRRDEAESASREASELSAGGAR